LQTGNDHVLTTARAQMDLVDDEVVYLDDACESRIEVLDGFAWITIDGDRQDGGARCRRILCGDTSDTVVISALRGTARVAVRASGSPVRRAADPAHRVPRRCAALRSRRACGAAGQRVAGAPSPSPECGWRSAPPRLESAMAKYPQEA
jgi:hypothetical protein